jgi:uncharacterized membrane protein
MNTLLQIGIIIAVAAVVITAIVLLIKEGPSGPGAGNIGNALQTAHEMFEPGMKNTIEINQKKNIKEDESGDLH